MATRVKPKVPVPGGNFAGLGAALEIRRPYLMHVSNIPAGACAHRSPPLAMPMLDWRQSSRS